MDQNSSFITKQEKRGVRNTYFGLYAASVEYVSDPMNLGRIKARVPGINDPDASRTPSTNLPWTLPCFVPGTFVVPDVGETVWIMFQRGQVDYPVYFGTWPGVTTTSRIRGRLPTLGAPEPMAENFVGQTVPTATGRGQDGDLAFDAVTNRIIGLNGGLDEFLPGFQFEVTGSASNNGIYTVVTNSGTEIVVAEPLQDEDRSTATLTGIQAPPHANNTKTYVQPPGNESPAESYGNKKSIDPTVRVLAKSPKGHTLYSVDDDENERFVMVDRAGTQLILSNPVSASANANNKARRIRGEADSKTALQIKDLVGQAGFAKLIDILGQFLVLSADGGGESVAELHGVPGDSGYFQVKQAGKLVTIWSDKKSIIQLDDNIHAASNEESAIVDLLSTGDIKITAAKGSSIIIKNKDGATITFDGPTIKLDNGAGATIEMTGTLIMENGG